MGLFENIISSSETAKTPLDPGWVRDKGGHFMRLLSLDPEEAGLSGKSGVFVIWHTGVKPGWVYVGHSEDLAHTFFILGKNKEVISFDNRGSLYVTWCFVRDKFADGVVAYLTQKLNPQVANPQMVEMKTSDMIAVYPPGKAPKG
ncbi:MAG: hypothetical protein CBB68_10855 [Rhodospirillaceae bacterium TMED8]|nr:hypothetical protein [Magnetovibrio sp.]OUT49906.1 MAG: hypothetical protein CBB68_10855 [Rhodospirillaceae bacterium TMED8]